VCVDHVSRVSTPLTRTRTISFSRTPILHLHLLQPPSVALFLAQGDSSMAELMRTIYREIGAIKSREASSENVRVYVCLSFTPMHTHTHTHTHTQTHAHPHTHTGTACGKRDTGCAQKANPHSHGDTEKVARTKVSVWHGALRLYGRSPFAGFVCMCVA